MPLPTDANRRKKIPLATGLLDYFPDACAAVAEVSAVGSEQHHPGQGVFWEKGKSTDHADCLLRHLLERGTLDTDGCAHTAKVAWRALALLQTEIEAAAKSQRAKELEEAHHYRVPCLCDGPCVRMTGRSISPHCYCKAGSEDA